MDYLSNVDKSEFFNEYWNKKPYKFRSNIDIVIPKDPISHILKSNIEFPQLRIVERGGSTNPFLYTRSNTKGLSQIIDQEKFNNLNLQGKTIKVLEIWRFFNEFENLKNWFLHYFPNSTITINGYFSYQNSLGASEHYDFYHIFVHQLEGVKKWKLGSMVEDNPVYEFGHKNIKSRQVLHEIETQAGDVLYIPPGVWHDVSTEFYSSHIAIGVNRQRVYEFINKSIKELAQNNSSLRADLSYLTVDNVKENVSSISEMDSIFEMIKAYMNNKYND